MTKTCSPLHALVALACLLAALASARAQTVNANQSIALQGLLASNGNGGFRAAAYAPDGSLILLEDRDDGIRVLKADAAGTTLLAQAHVGAQNDSGIAMALDSNGNVYVTGTTYSGTLSSTSGVAFPAPTDASVNGFLAKFDSDLHPIFVTFLGAGRTSPTAIAVTRDAVFVTGITYSTAFPVTPAGIQQTPSTGSNGNGFVERFDTAGTTLAYATYLTGYGGDTMPAGIAADATDNAYVTGLTTASGFPTTSALQPEMIGAASGFLAKLTPAGDGFLFSTFIAGNGLTGIDLDRASSTLLLSGNVSLGGFPIATASGPIASASYQTLLRITEDGQSMPQSVLLLPGISSHVASAADGSAWISGTLSTPLFPGLPSPNASSGDGFLLHVMADGTIDQTLRMGGLAVNNPLYASLSDEPAAPAVSSDGATIALASTLSTTVAASLAATQRFDVPLVVAPNNLLTSTPHDAVSPCTDGQCSGNGGMLTLVSTSAAQASLGLSFDDLPNVTLRNLGSSAADGLALAASGYTQTNDCGASLAPSTACGLALTGDGPGSLTVSSSGAASTTSPLPANTLAPESIALSTNELDFGIVTASTPASRTLIVTNLTNTPQAFSSVLEGMTTPYNFAQSATDCTTGSTTSTFTVAAGGSCTLTFTLSAGSSSSSDGPASGSWKIGTRDIHWTGFAQAADVSVSATEIDFGVQFAGAAAAQLPRYLFLSNSGSHATAHTPVALLSGSPFTVTDECPSSLPQRSVCRIDLAYASTTAPSKDTATLTLDNGLSVLLNGETLPPASTIGSIVNPDLNVAPASLNFATPVPVTGVSGTTQTVTVRNTGTSAMGLQFAVSGDFSLGNNCPATLNGGATCTVTIAFAPSQPGERQGLLSVTGGTGFTPIYVALSGTATAILPANNGALALGQTYAGEPLVVWYKVQQSFPSLTARSGNLAFGVALVEDTGYGHGTLPAASFTASATSTCSNCWLGIQFSAATAGDANGTLTLSTASAGNPYALQLTATALPVSGLLLNPLAASFGTVAVDSSSAATTLTVTNLLPNSADIRVQSVSATGDFSIAANTTGGTSCSGVLPSTTSCFVQAVFTPTATGERTGSIAITTDSGTITAMLIGYGSADPGIAFTPSSLVFANVPGVAATEQTISVSNTAAYPLTFGAITSTDTAFTLSTTCSTLAPGALCSIDILFAPRNEFVSATLNVPVAATVNGQPVNATYTIPLSGNYAAQAAGLAILPSQSDFGAQAADSLGLTRAFTLANFSAKTLRIQLNVPQQFPLATEPTVCMTLAPGTSCSFSLGFLPAVSGEATGTVTATGTPTDGSPALQTLAYMIGYGTGEGSLTLSAASLIPNAPLNFGQLNSGQTTQQVLTLTNNASATVTVRRIVVEPPFFSATTCGAALAPNASCTITLTYAPVDEVAIASGARSDTAQLLVESNASTSPLTLALTGSVDPAVSTDPGSSGTLNTYALSSWSLTFTNTAIGSATAQQTLTLTNTGNATLHIASITASPDYQATTTCASVPVGASCTISVAFSPTTSSSRSQRPGVLAINSDAANALEFVTLLGTSSPSPLLLSPTALDFGTVDTGSSSTLPVNVANTTSAPVTFTDLTTDGDYTTSAGTCPAPGTTLAAGSSCSVTVTFAPTASGTRTGTLHIGTDATQVPLTVALTGIGALAKLTASPSAIAFGPIGTGASTNQPLTLSNAGASTVTGIHTSITGANAADFTVTTFCATTQLSARQACTLGVMFTPSVTASESATLLIASSDPDSPLQIPLTGQGVRSGSFTLTVDGGTSATRPVNDGSPAAYGLLLTATGGFTGTVALTCAPVTPVQYGACSLLPSSLTLQNSLPQSSTVTISTVSSLAVHGGIVIAMLLLLPWRKRRRGWITAAMLLAGLTALSSCGGSGSIGNPNLRYTPAGTYQYTVTASATSGAPTSSRVTLTLVVQ